MNTYKAFYQQRPTIIYAETLYEAMQEALKFYKPPQSKKNLVAVVLVEKDGKPVIHSGAEL